MVQEFGQYGGLARTASDVMGRSAAAWARGVQAMAMEMGEYAKRSLDQGAAAAQKLSAARTLERAVEIQTEFARSAYEGFVAQAKSCGEIAGTTMREVVAPLSGAVPRAA